MRRMSFALPLAGVALSVAVQGRLRFAAVAVPGGLSARSRSGVVAMGMGVGVGVEVVKAASDQRLYEVLKLENGLTALVIHDPAMSGLQAEEEGQGGCGRGGACGHDHEYDDEDDEDDEDYEEGEDEEDDDDEEEDDDDDDDEMEVDGGVKRGHKGCCSNGRGTKTEGKTKPGFDVSRRPARSPKLGDCDEEGEDEDDEDDEDDDEESDDDDDEDGPSHGGAMQAPTKKAAAAMCVGVGSFSDPADAQGLAHFLEHMLFMGSEKFPDENEYDNFLSKHGGGSNAFTDTEFTCYHFEVSPNHLQPALDRFSQFFIAPLAKPETMDREVQAIDSEFEQALQNDSCRLLQLQCHTAKPNHPFRSFSWGNKNSLGEPMGKGVDMRAKLIQLYKDHYLASRMKLTVLGGEPLETLKTWVTESFGKVKEGGEALKFPWDGPVWEPGSLYRVESVKDQHLIALTWPFPCLEAAYLKKPQDYISHLIGHEGAGSLLSLLKEKGWATGLSAGVGEGGYDHSSAGYMFSVNIWLTDSGIEHVLDVVEMLFQYVKMLRTTGPQKWVFDELQAMGMMEFRFAEEESADQYVVRLASNMHLYSEEHTIYGDYAFEEWDPELVADLIDRVNPYNMRLDLVTKNFDKTSPGVQYEPWFEVPYTVETVPDEILKRWANPEHVDPALRMPIVNAFIPHDFTIRTGKTETPEPDVPTVLLDEEGLKVWYKLDRTFNTPRANTYFSVTCKAASENIRNIVLTEIYVKLLEHELNETIYLANVAKLESSMTFSGDKLDLKIFGFNEKLPVLASKIAELLTSLVPREDRFQVIMEELERGYRNTNMKPLKHSAYLRLQALKERFWHVDDKLACLLTLTVSDVAKHIPHLFSETYIEALCHGNLYEEEAIGIANIFKQSLVKTALPAESRPIERIVKLDPSSALLYTANVKNEAEENSIVEMYFQLEKDLGKESLRVRSLMDLLEQMIQEPCFNQLRTKEQLGYRVDCGVRVTFKILGFCFRVQSAKFNPVFVEQRINAFITSLSQILNDVDEDEFSEYKEALIEEKLERDHSLVDETDRHWEQIWDQRYA
ncbi:hypothetical protein KC19_VG069600 [Ceratodon purpureus]|uniref:Uncharacterized protein n=1 Tax=Ceratodon purpureus TaxID=3225 RepID=A0A8T0HMT1_CERPU|nr:hypothetical protein KC19_VG069600 [Ceratodon purpureus]